MPKAIATKSEHQQRVEKFMQRAQHDVPNFPTVPLNAVCELRASLILEEALETIEALGVSISLTSRAIVGGMQKLTQRLTMDDLQIEATHDPSLVGIADGCADISVVTTGTLSACGIADAELLRMVDDSNLAKFEGDYHVRADGKLVKPTDWKAPDIAQLLADLGA